MIPTFSRELVARLESDLESVDGRSRKDECIKLQAEIDKMKTELEHRALKGDFNINSRILHFKMNPAAIAGQQADDKHKVLLEEVEQLRTEVASGSSGKARVSTLQTQGRTNDSMLSRGFEIFKIIVLRKSII